MVKIPAKLGNQAVTAVAAPKSRSEITASVCSRMKMMIAMTPMAKKPGISRTVWSQPISTPVNPASSTTKLFKSADQVAKANGIPAAIRNNRKMG